MFSLIISIIAIALVAALALASIYYGGSAFQEGSADAEASTAVNQGQQIQAAFTMAAVAEDTNASTVAELSNTTGGVFLKETPKMRGLAWTKDASNAGYISVQVNSKAICESIEERFDSVKTLESVADLNSVLSKQAFGCFEDSTPTATYVAYYKL